MACETLTYAGVGARKTPDEVLRAFESLAAALAAGGWHLRTGGASGADEAFMLGAPGSARTVIVPWPKFQNRAGPDVVALPADRYGDLAAAAAAHHEGWHACRQAVRNLHARNAAVVLGMELDDPVAAVVCWTPGGRPVGGTGQAIRMAKASGIPVCNAAVEPIARIRRRLEGLARAREVQRTAALGAAA